MDAAHLGKADRKDLAEAAKKAQKAMKAVSEFSGRQIAAALVAGKDGFLDWKAGDPVAKAILTAIDAQAELSIRLTDIANSLADSPDVADGDAFDALSELALQCDRRQSEIFNLAMELTDVVADSGDDPRLDAKLAALLPSQAVSMHGNLDVIDKLKAQLQPLADRLEAFAARPAASITSAEFTAYAAEVKNASAAISRALKEGFPALGGGRFRPDRAFMASLAELARFAEGKLENVRKTVGEARLRDFANRVIGLPESVPIFDPENLAGLNQYAPALVKIVKLRRQLRDACLQYVDNPTKEMEAKIEGLFSAYSSIDTDGLKDKVDYLRSHLKGMSTADWEEATRFLRPKLRTLRTQIVHFGQMVRRVNARLTPEQFLSTDSARALQPRQTRQRQIPVFLRKRNRRAGRAPAPLPLLPRPLRAPGEKWLVPLIRGRLLGSYAIFLRMENPAKDKQPATRRVRAVTLVPLEADDRDQFVRDNQESFNYRRVLQQPPPRPPRPRHFLFRCPRRP